MLTFFLNSSDTSHMASLIWYTLLLSSLSEDMHFHLIQWSKYCLHSKYIWSIRMHCILNLFCCFFISYMFLILLAKSALQIWIGIPIQRNERPTAFLEFSEEFTWKADRGNNILMNFFNDFKNLLSS